MFLSSDDAGNLEIASLPTTTPEERKKLLSFVVCGGGPTGVEIAAELADMLEEDVLDCVSLLTPGIRLTLSTPGFSRMTCPSALSRAATTFSTRTLKRSRSLPRSVSNVRM
jgi:NADH dehydrogenase FAD-containing subunit